MSGWRFNFITKHFYKSSPENLSDFNDSISKLQEHNGLIQCEKLGENLLLFKVFKTKP